MVEDEVVVVVSWSAPLRASRTLFMIPDMVEVLCVEVVVVVLRMQWLFGDVNVAWRADGG